VILTAWTRPTFEWALSCEDEISRSTAANYYSDTFADPESIYDSEHYAKMMLYVAGCSLAAFLLVDLHHCCSKRDSNSLLFINSFGLFASRIALLYYVYKCFYFVN